jgi:hypothetical protein
MMLQKWWTFMNFYVHELIMNSVNSRMFMNISWIRLMNNSWRCNELIIGQFIMMQIWWTFMNFYVHELFMKQNIHECSSTCFHEQIFMISKCPIISSLHLHELFMNVSWLFMNYSRKFMNYSWSSRRGRECLAKRTRVIVFKMR